MVSVVLVASPESPAVAVQRTSQLIFLTCLPISVSDQISCIALIPIAPNNNQPIVFMNPNFQIHPITSASDVHGYLDIALAGLFINDSTVSS